MQANIPMQDLDSFTNYCWFSDGSIDWIDCPYPSDIADLFEKGESTEQNDLNNDLVADFEEDDGLGDESDVEDDDDE